MTILGTLRKRSFQALGAWALALTQMFFSAGCRQATGVNMGQILYELLHHGYETKGETAKAAALEARHDDFVNAVNRIIPADVSGNLFPTLRSLLPLVDEGVVEGATADVDLIIQDL